jgi:predicted amidohydrolase
MLRVAALQLRTCSSRAETLKRASALVKEAAGRGAQLVCLPEAWTGLYGVEFFKGNAERWKSEDSGTELMSRLADEHGIYVVGGVIEQHPTTDTMFNTVAAFGPTGEEVARYRKMHLSCVTVGGDQTSEGSVLEAGKELSWFDIGSDSPGSDGSHSWRVGLANCFDLRFKDLSDMLTAPPPDGFGCDLLLYPACWLKSTGSLGHWEILLKSRALDGQCYVMGCCNASDDTQPTVAFGRSCVIGPMAETLAVCSDDTASEVVIADLCHGHLADTRQRIPLSTVKGGIAYKDVLHAARQADSSVDSSIDAL